MTRKDIGAGAQKASGGQPRSMDYSTNSDSEDVDKEAPHEIILSGITEDIRKGETGSESLLGKYRDAVEKCIYITDSGKDTPTILHWVASKLKVLNKKKNEVEFRALLELAKISVRTSPKVIHFPSQDGTKNTPLHIAVGFPKLELLAQKICEEAEKVKLVVLREAIAAQNFRGETCIHIAIANRLSIASYLIKRADRDTFKIQRHDEESPSGTLPEGGGNTPLHDAVYFNCCHENQNSAKASKSSTSDKCKTSFNMRRDRTLDIIAGLISKNKEALTIKNSAHETPYLHHLSTKQKALKLHLTPPPGVLNTLASETGGTTTPKLVGPTDTLRQKDLSSQTEGIISNVGIKGNEITYRSNQSNANVIINSVNRSVPGTQVMDNSPTFGYQLGSFNVANNQHQSMTSFGGAVVPGGSVGQNSVLYNVVMNLDEITKPITSDHLETLARYNKELVSLTSQSLEWARALPRTRELLVQVNGPGNQESKTGQDAKGVGLVIPPLGDPPKAAKAATTATTLIYKDDCFGLSLQIAAAVEELLLESSLTTGDFTHICGCLFSNEKDPDGREPIFRPLPIEPSGNYYGMVHLTKTLAQVDLKLAVIDNTKNQEQKEVLWENNTKALKRIFDMLRKEKEVEKILKLTVIDNIEMPCSDEIIEYCLEGFDIRYLNWRKPDLCTEVILAKAPNVAELTLHSSGNNAVLRGWASQGGLCRLDKLTKVTIHADRSFGDYDPYLDRVDYFLQDLESCVNVHRRKLFLESEKPKIEAELKRSRGENFPPNAEGGGLPAGEQEPNVSPSANGEGLSSGQKRPTTVSQVSEMLLVGANEAVAETEDIIKSIDEQLVQLQEDLEEIEKSRRRRRGEEEAMQKKRWKQRRANLVLQTETKNPRVLLLLDGKVFKSEEENRGMLDRKLFKSTQGYVATTFSVHSHREGPPQQKPSIKPPPVAGNTSGNTTTAGTGKHPWIKSVEAFVKKNIKEAELNNPEIKSMQEIKVALIDDGFSVNTPKLDDCIAKIGWPRLAPTDESQPWYQSTSGHGTAMAELIIRACPRAKLYIAKLGTWEDSERIATFENESTATKATEAIQWAIDMQVNVICMSWNLIKTRENGKQIAELDQMVQKAANKHGIIMYCAAGDEGLYGKHELYPASSKTTLIKVVGSAGIQGQKSVFVDGSKVDYLFPGEEIDQFKYGKGAGSSAATALAAGFAALILWCFERDRKGGMKKVKKPELMNLVLDGLVRAHSKEEKWVDGTILLGSSGDRSVKEFVDGCKKYF